MSQHDISTYPLPGEAHARAHDPITAKLAADAIQGTRATILEGQVLRTLREVGPRTAWEISLIADLEYGSTSPRLVNLEKKGFVRRLPPVSRGGRRLSILWEALGEQG